MKLGLPAAGMGATISIDIDLIRAAEELGDDSVWTAEACGADAICLVEPKQRVRDGFAVWEASRATMLVLQGPNSGTLRTTAELCL